MTFVTEKGRKFTHKVLPDTGCTQTIVSKDIASKYSMVIDESKKKRIRNASDEPMNCEGTVVLETQFEDQKTNVAALVSSSMSGEILLG